MANIIVKLWGHVLLQQWDTQINIPEVSEMDHKPTLMSGRDILRSDKNSLTIQAVHKHRTTTGKLSEVPKSLCLKWLTEKPVGLGKELCETAGFRGVGPRTARCSAHGNGLVLS